jgi:hypothetical protein
MKLNLFYLTKKLLGSALLVVGLASIFSGSGRAAEEQTFASPDEAVAALVTAASKDDTNALHAIFGPEGKELISPDAVQATEEFELFAQRLAAKHELVTNADGNLTLEIGADEWPFPIPLAQETNQWFFDTAAGKTEILNRRIGMNELGAIDVCRAYVDAQREYASESRTDDGVLGYAQLLRSTPGKHDGLFWPPENGQPLSPLGPLVAAARDEGYRHTAKMMSDELAPYHGYYFKILTKQGKHAPGGEYNYVINGHMIVGFALVAWPAEWGNTGIMTFMVNDQGKVYQKNLGKRTGKIASSMKRFDPDGTWAVVP